MLQHLKEHLKRTPPEEKLRHVTAMIAVAVLGGIVGWFTGQSGSDATVLAAVLPVVLTGGGFLVVLRSEDRDTPHLGIIVNMLIVVFVVFLLFGALKGRADLVETKDKDLKLTLKRESEYRAQEESKRHDREWQFRNESLKKLRKYLEDCSIEEARVNSLRQASGLPPLPSEVFCR